MTINGQSTEMMTHKDAVTLLKQAQGSVDMEVAPAAEESSSAAEDNDDGSDDESLPGSVFLYTCSRVLSIKFKC